MDSERSSLNTAREISPRSQNWPYGLSPSHDLWRGPKDANISNVSRTSFGYDDEHVSGETLKLMREVLNGEHDELIRRLQNTYDNIAIDPHSQLYVPNMMDNIGRYAFGNPPSRNTQERQVADIGNLRASGSFLDPMFFQHNIENMRMEIPNAPKYQAQWPSISPAGGLYALNTDTPPPPRPILGKRRRTVSPLPNGLKRFATPSSRMQLVDASTSHASDVIENEQADRWLRRLQDGTVPLKIPNRQILSQGHSFEELMWAAEESTPPLRIHPLLKGANRKAKTPPKDSTSAAQLLHRRSGGLQRKYAIPWGHQRILTQTMVDKLATKLGTSIPFVLDSDVTSFFSNQMGQHIDPIKSFLPPENIDFQLLGSIQITAEEILTFLPNALKSPDCVYRLAQNGWSCADMAGYINYARQLSYPDYSKGNGILKWLQKADLEILGLSSLGSSSRKPWKTTRFSASQWKLPQKAHNTREGRIDYFLVDLGNGIVNWPEGDGARLLTRAVEFAVRNGYRHARLSQIMEFVREHLLLFPPLEPMAGMRVIGSKNPDVVARERVKEKIVFDRRRILSEKRDKKGLDTD